jgi:hypothetical protein
VPIKSPKGPKLNQKYPENQVIDKYLNYNPLSKITVQLSDRQIMTDDGDYGKLKPIYGFELVSEYDENEYSENIGKKEKKHFLLKYWTAIKIFIFVWFSYKITSYLPGFHGFILFYLPDWSIFRWLFAPPT